MLALCLLPAIASTAPCCTTCGEGFVKAYSIDGRHDLCGESCVHPSFFWVYRALEPNLTIARSPTPCDGAGFPAYLRTVRHGGLLLAAEVDLYARERSFWSAPF